eukprot:jgi/Chlat1/3567/Chrsp234S03594
MHARVCWLLPWMALGSCLALCSRCQRHRTDEKLVFPSLETLQTVLFQSVPSTIFMDVNVELGNNIALILLVAPEQIVDYKQALQEPLNIL